MVEPSYQELGPEQLVLIISDYNVFILTFILYRIPVAFPEGPDGSVKIRVISGKSHGVESPVRPLGGCWYFHVIFSKKSTIFQHLRKSLPPFALDRVTQIHVSAVGWSSFIYIWKGSITIGDSTMPIDAFNTIVLSADDTQTGVKVTATEDDTEFVLVCTFPIIAYEITYLEQTDLWRAPRPDRFSVRSFRND